MSTSKSAVNNNYLGTLEHYHQLADEVSCDLKKGFVVSIYGLDLAIIYRIKHIIKFVIEFYKGSPQLNISTTRSQFTPLHIACIVGNGEALKQLLEAGANPNLPDIQNWLPLHHAALVCQQHIPLLLAAGSKEKAETKTGGTYLDILRITQPVKKDSREAIMLMWKNEKGQEKLLTVGEFKQLTGAEFIEEHRANPDQMWNLWQSPLATRNELQFTEEVKKNYSEFTAHPPIHVLSQSTHDSDGNALLSSPGFGLFARRAMTARQIVGEYLGVIGTQDQPYNHFLLNCGDKLVVNSKEERNEIPFINDGFNNLVLVPVHDLKDLPTRSLLVTAGPVAAGEQYCWNYGGLTVKLGPYVELRPRETREFIKNEKIDELARCLTTVGASGNLSFEDFVRAEKFRYILSTPAALFAMTFDGTLDLSKAQKLHQLAYSLGCIPSHAPDRLRSLIKHVLDCCQMKKLLQPCFPRFALVYSQYLNSLPARVGILQTLCAVEDINDFLSRKISILLNDPITKKGMSHEMPKIDDFFLNLWQKEILVGIEICIAEIQKR